MADSNWICSSYLKKNIAKLLTRLIGENIPLSIQYYCSILQYIEIKIIFRNPCFTSQCSLLICKNSTNQPFEEALPFSDYSTLNPFMRINVPHVRGGLPVCIQADNTKGSSNMNRAPVTNRNFPSICQCKIYL